MIEREITDRLKALFEQYPFVTVTGPRQSGKTTLCRAAFPNHEYVNLEAPDDRDFAESDPRGFLARLGDGAIIDEVQYVPGLLSYLQVLADERGRNGQFVLTGSEQFQISDAISQSLAGRTALLRLLPLSLRERRRAGASAAIDDIIYSGFYPRIHDQGLDPRQAMRDYFETYVERDVRRLGGIRNLSAFRLFVRLCAGRVGQLVNLSSLGSDAGVSHTTAREWLAVLERSYIAFQLPPFHANIRKRLVRSPKLYFYDVGLATYLVGIESPSQVATHHLRGALFENVVVSEALKYGFNRDRQPSLSFFRDQGGLECDLFYETGHGIKAIEVKSGSTVASDYFTSLNRVAGLVPDVSTKTVVYGGTARQSRGDCAVVPLAEFAGVLERFEVDRDVAAFVRERKGGPPDASDVEKLDAAYFLHIRPILAALGDPCQELGKQLFRDFAEADHVESSGRRIGGSGLLDARYWDETKAQHIVVPGFTLSDERSIELVRSYGFRDYAGEGDSDFGVRVTLAWELGTTSLWRSVSIDDTPIPDLGVRIAYSQLDAQGPDTDHVVAAILKRLLARIAGHSAR
jgi:hypothetical protein